MIIYQGYGVCPTCDLPVHTALQAAEVSRIIWVISSHGLTHYTLMLFLCHLPCQHWPETLLAAGVLFLQDDHLRQHNMG